MPGAGEQRCPRDVAFSCSFNHEASQGGGCLRVTCSEISSNVFGGNRNLGGTEGLCRRTCFPQLFFVNPAEVLCRLWGLYYCFAIAVCSERVEKHAIIPPPMRETRFNFQTSA